MAAPKDDSRPTSPGSTLSTCTLHGWAPPLFPTMEDSASAVETNSGSCNAPSSRTRAASTPRCLFGRKASRLNLVFVAAREVFLFVILDLGSALGGASLYRRRDVRAVGYQGLLERFS